MIASGAVADSHVNVVLAPHFMSTNKKLALIVMLSQRTMPRFYKITET